MGRDARTNDLLLTHATPRQPAPALPADAAGLETPREVRRRGTRSNAEARASSRPTSRRRVERQLQPRMRGSARRDADSGGCSERGEEEQESIVHVLDLHLLAYRSTGGCTRGARAHVDHVIHGDAEAGGTSAGTEALAASRAWAVQSLGGRQPAAALAGAASTRNVAEVAEGAELRLSDTAHDADGESRAKVLCAGAAASSRAWAAASSSAALRAQQPEQWVGQNSVVASDTISSSPPLCAPAAHQTTLATAGASYTSTSPAGLDALSSAPPTSERGVPAYILRRAQSFKFKHER